MIRGHNENTLKTGKAVPQGAVNLACYAIRKPDIAENVQIASMVEKSVQPYLTMEVGTGNMLVNTTTSKLFLITDKTDSSGDPLYYVYTLQLKIRSSSPDKKISIISDKGYVPENYKIKQELVPIGQDLYAVKLFTNFWADKVACFYAIYNGIRDDGTLDIGRKELINPQPYMKSTTEVPHDNEYRVIPTNNGENKIEVSGLSSRYYISTMDGGNILAKTPISIQGAWYPRVINGRMTKNNPNTKIPEKMLYTVPDYYNQQFSAHGMPYIQITEQANVVSRTAIKVANTPIYAPIDSNGNVTNISIVIKGLSTAEDRNVSATAVDSNSGTIYVAGFVNPNDTVQVTYHYMEDAFIYKGYYDEDTGAHVPLDVNPSQGHTYGYMNKDKQLIVEPSFRLLNKTLYIYAKPSIIEVNSINVNDEEITIPSGLALGSTYKVTFKYIARRNAHIKVRTKYSDKELSRAIGGSNACSWDFASGNDESADSIVIYNANLLCGEPILVDYLKTDNNYQILKQIDSNTIFHTVDKLTIQEEDEMRAILIAKIYVRPNSSRDTVKLIDTRTRGGGFIDMDDILRLKTNPETQYYLDIGSIYGEPLQENAVIVIKVNKYLLKQYGGVFSETDVEAAVEKYKAFGVLPVIEYIEPANHNVFI